MLVLSRRESQRIQLGKSIVVTIVRVKGDRVRLGIEAPNDIRVLRASWNRMRHRRPIWCPRPSSNLRGAMAGR